MRVAILGLGQIGGSVGRALVAAGDPWHVAGWTRSDAARRAAGSDGIEVASSARAAIGGADVVILAVPPLACLELLDEIAGPLHDAVAADAVITDVASTKVAIVDRAAERGLRFVGGHPMAGRDATGYAAAEPGLFVGRPWVVTEPDPQDAIARDRVGAVAIACGARVLHLGAAEHDAAVAAISHLPLIVSAALVEATAAGSDWPIAEELAAGGWASMTRLARGDVEMGTGIVATNAPAIAARLRALRVVLDGWLAELEAEPPDVAQLRHRLASARRVIADDPDGR